MTARNWLAATACLTIAAAVAGGFRWTLQRADERLVEGKPVEIRIIGSPFGPVSPPECPTSLGSPTSWRAVRTEAGYLLDLSTDEGVLDPQGAWAWFNQARLGTTETRIGFHFVDPLIGGAQGAVWVSQADLYAYGIRPEDQLAALRLMEITGHYLKPVWRVTCRWEPGEAVRRAMASSPDRVGDVFPPARVANTASWFDQIREQEQQ